MLKQSENATPENVIKLVNSFINKYQGALSTIQKHKDMLRYAEKELREFGAVEAPNEIDRYLSKVTAGTHPENTP